MAYGGAKIAQPVKEKIRGNPTRFYIVPNLSQQIDSYLKEYGAFLPEDLIVVFIGTNDYSAFFHRHSNTTHLANQETVQINRLIQNGAQQIIVFNIRNLTYVPFIQLLHSKKYFPLNIAEKYYTKYLSKSILIFNRRLEENLKNNPKVFIYDIFNFDNVIFSKIKKNGYSYSMGNKNYNLRYGSIPCYKNYKNDYQHIVSSVCENSMEYFFYDRIHTTTAVNFLLAEDVYQQFSNKK
jgi:phospholipase/lecithinase/hemolysin